MAKVVIDLTAENTAEIGDQCPICLEMLQAKTISHIGCPHRFCWNCIFTWITSSRKYQCPICKKQARFVSKLHEGQAEDILQIVF